MSSPATFDVETYFNEFADASAIAEAARIRTVPTGSYTLQVTKREGRYFELKESQNGGGQYWSMVFSDESTVNPEWRKGFRFYASVMDAEGKKLRSINVDASWEHKRDGRTWVRPCSPTSRTRNGHRSLLVIS
jgi:hypothetical protein